MTDCGRHRGPFRRLLQRRVGGRLWLRLQTALVLALSFMLGAAGAHLMLKAGLVDLRWRLPLTVLVAYGGFLLFVRGWMALAGVERIAAQPDPDYAEPEREKRSSSDRFAEAADDVVDGVGSLGDLATVDAEGCLPAIALALALVVLGIVLSALWWFFGGFFGAATAALLEAGVDALLAVGMARAAGGNAASWLAGALRASWKYWLALAVLAWLVACALHAVAPGAATVYQSIVSVAASW